MARTMYDAVTPANIPADAEAVAGYIDGRYAWSAADWARFPTPVKVTIAVFAGHDAKCLDVETGDATPDQAPGWVTRQRARGETHPWVYCSESVWPAVRAAFANQQVPEPIWWIAGYPGSVGHNLYPGAHAHQFIDDGPYDRSVIADHIPGIDPPTPTAAPEDPDMISRIIFYATVAGGQAAFLSDGTWFRWISDPEVTDAPGVLSELGVKVVYHEPRTPVADLKAFGRPQDKTTADLVGLAFP